jgi:hypothetical protein
MDSLPPPTRSSWFVFAARSAPVRAEVPSRPGLWGAGRPSFRLLRVDARGISQVSRRSFPCLCSAPRPRSNRHVLANSRPHQCCPRYPYSEGFGNCYFGAHSRSFGTRCPTLRVLCCHSRARLASGWLASLCREGVEPSGPLRKVSVRLTIVPLSCSPDATGCRLRSIRAT